jgi:hypothetical protein
MKRFFFPVPMEDSRILEAKKTTFLCRHGLCNILFKSLGELGTCLQNLISTRGVEHWIFFSTMRYVEIQKHGPFFDDRKDISKIVVSKIQTVSTYIGASSIHRPLVSWKTSKSQFLGGTSKFPKLIIFGQTLAVWGKIYCIASG